MPPIPPFRGAISTTIDVKSSFISWVLLLMVQKSSDHHLGCVNLHISPTFDAEKSLQLWLPNEWTAWQGNGGKGSREHHFLPGGRWLKKDQHQR